MKIFLYIDCMQMGGANRVMANLSDYFQNTGHDVVLINDIKPVEGIPEYPVSVKRVFLDPNRETAEFKNLKRITCLRKLVKKERPDVVVSFMGPPNIRMLLSTIGLKTRKIVSVRNDPYQEYGSGIKRIIAKTIFCLADGCVFQTKDAARYFGNRFQKRSRIIYNPVNPKFYKYKWNKQKNEIAVVGRLQSQKNPLLAVNAFALIADRYLDYTLVFYGDNELKDRIKERANELGISDRVRIHGKSSTIENHLEESALYLLSSDYEGMPNALMEAMAVGIPAISTDCPCGGPRTLIQNDKQGVLVPVKDEVAMSEAMDRVLSDENLQKNMSIEERKRAKDFTPDNIFRQWEDFLKA